MKKKTWVRHHRYFGLVLAFFIIMFCLSGLVLNHPSLFSDVNVSRSLLPTDYRYKQWNGGLLRGTLLWRNSVLVYGNSGIWLADARASAFKDFNAGLPEGADMRNIRGLAILPSGNLFAAGAYGLYEYRHPDGWQERVLPRDEDERLSDISTLGDTLIITGRSYIYMSLPPYRTFHKIILPATDDADGKVSLFKTIWQLHSGELFGLAGRLVVDAIALVLIFLSLSGVLYWLFPHVMKHRPARLMRKLFSWHDAVGRITIVLTLFICITGWLLRPPALIAIASAKIPPIPGSALDSDNPWHEKLRTLRYDKNEGDWLLYTSDGFFSLKHFMDAPWPVEPAPPVSVMGINVQQRDEHGNWLIGSFNGLYVWQRKTGQVFDYRNHQPAGKVSRIPDLGNAVAGYTADFTGGHRVVDYYSGTPSLPMPARMTDLPISLRALALEVHTGRIYTFFGGSNNILYIFLIGLAIAWCLWTGWKLRTKPHKRQTTNLKR